MKLYSLTALLILVVQAQSLHAEDLPPDQVPSVDATVPSPEKEDKHYTLSADITLGTSVAIGTFLPGLRRQTGINTYVVLEPAFKINKWGNVPDMMLKARWLIGMDWINNLETIASTYAYKPQLGDIDLFFSMPKVAEWKDVGIAITPAAGIVAPASRASWSIARVLGLAVMGTFQFAKWDFTLIYQPKFVGWIYDSPGVVVPCQNGFEGSARSLPPLMNPGDPDFQLDSYAVSTISYSAVSRLPNGQCMLDTRQPVAQLNNKIALSWTKGSHDITAMLIWMSLFLRPLSPTDSISPYANNMNLKEMSVGLLAYTYTLPLQFNSTIAAGVLSIQYATDTHGNIRVPFIDLTSPANNNTQFFVEFGVGI